MYNILIFQEAKPSVRLSGIAGHREGIKRVT